ncbi:MAG: hypothetical protein JWP06_345 [Candidatus Saccharibacteria bacterium]|nr:hypothetical protein [Candidatus Saccharibacteria bacterium]
MATAIFCLVILSEIGMLLIPLTSATRGRAVWGWLANLLGAGAFFTLITEYYPSWEEPQWHAGTAWALITWALCLAGLIVAIRKPRKRNAPVA